MIVRHDGLGEIAAPDFFSADYGRDVGSFVRPSI